MPDAIDNLAQDLNQVGVNPYEYAVLTDEGYVNTIPNPNFVEPYAYPNPPRFGLPEQPSGMFDPVLDYGSRQWLDRRIRSPNPIAQDLSNPSTFKTGEGIDFDARDQPVERINEGSTDEKDAFVRTGIGTTLDPKTEDFYGVKGLVPPDQAGGFVGVDYLTPKQIEDLTAGQTPSVGQGVVTRGETVKIPGKGLPDYIPIGQMENGDVLYADRNNIRDTIIRPSAYSVSQEDLDKGVVPQKFDFGTNTAPSTSQVTPTPVESYQPVGADEPTTTSVGDFSNTGGNVTVGPGGVKDITPDWKEEAKPKPGDEFKDSPWSVFDPNAPTKKPIVTPGGLTEGTVVPGTGGTRVGDEVINNAGQKYDWETDTWSPIPGGKDTTKPPVVTPPTGGGQPPTGGTKPGGVITGPGTGTGTYTGTPLPTREPVTPLVRRETVIPTKGTKEVPLPDRQADPFAKLYADLLANSQQQQDQYRYINYDPEQIMNAAMSGFRRRGAMRSLQGY
jgi:hypothetical protein